MPNHEPLQPAFPPRGIRQVGAPISGARPASTRSPLIYEITSGLSGLILALFMWGHMLMVGSILTGTRGFDFVAKALEDFYIAQPTVVVISVLFVIHAVMASRKIPAQLRDRKRLRKLATGLKQPSSSASGRVVPFKPHLESMLWIWQVRTGMVVLLLGSFHLVLVTLDSLTGLFGERVGIEAASTVERVGSGLWILYGVLLVCVEFHASVGLYRLAVKWGVGSRISRKTLWRLERVIFWAFLGLGLLTLVVLAGWVPAPLGYLLEASTWNE